MCNRAGTRPATRLALTALAAATVAMLTLHVVQRSLNPLEEPVSFYVHGTHGWLISAALNCFGAAALAAAWGAAEKPEERWVLWSLIVFGAGMILAGVVPSDRWFPWQAAPTGSGLIHASASVLTPPILLVAMLRDPRRIGSRWRRIKMVSIVAYALGLVASASALAIGFALDGPPPLIGLAERVLALGGVAWLTVIALDHDNCESAGAPKGA